MQDVPYYTDLIFISTVALTLWVFFRAGKNNGLTLIVLLALAFVQGLLAKTSFFITQEGQCTRFVLVPASAVLIIIFLFLRTSGRNYLQNLDLKMLTMIHVVRIPVELVLYMLYTDKAVPQLMTFEGDNPDILSGITAPLVVLLFFKKNSLNRMGLIIWNLGCLALLLNVVIRAVLSLPSPFQKLAFDQPNLAVLHFPYVWLPGLVVPLVLLSHLASLWQLMKLRKTSETT